MSLGRTASARSSRSFAFTRRLGVLCLKHIQLRVNAINFLAVDALAFAIQQGMETPIAVAHARLADHLEPLGIGGITPAQKLKMAA